MEKKINSFLSIFLVILTFFAVGSCKKDTPEQGPETYDSSVDGIAVRPLPEIDIELAQRIAREGAVSPLEDATDESVLALATAQPAAAETEARTPTGTTKYADDYYDDTSADEYASADPNFY